MGGEQMDYYAIGQRIRRCRKAQGLTQEQLAETVDVSPTHVSHIETGVTKLSLPVLVKIADALKVRLDALLHDAPHDNADSAAEEVMAVLAACDADQRRIIADIVRATKQSLDAHLK